MKNRRIRRTRIRHPRRPRSTHRETWGSGARGAHKVTTVEGDAAPNQPRATSTTSGPAPPAPAGAPAGDLEESLQRASTISPSSKAALDSHRELGDLAPKARTKSPPSKTTPWRTTTGNSSTLPPRPAPPVPPRAVPPRAAPPRAAPPHPAPPHPAPRRAAPPHPAPRRAGDLEESPHQTSTKSPSPRAALNPHLELGDLAVEAHTKSPPSKATLRRTNHGPPQQPPAPRHRHPQALLAILKNRRRGQARNRHP